MTRPKSNARAENRTRMMSPSGDFESDQRSRPDNDLARPLPNSASVRVRGRPAPSGQSASKAASKRAAEADERRRKHERLKPSDRKLNGPLKINMRFEEAVRFALRAGKPPEPSRSLLRRIGGEVER